MQVNLLAALSPVQQTTAELSRRSGDVPAQLAHRLAAMRLPEAVVVAARQPSRPDRRLHQRKSAGPAQVRADLPADHECGP